MDSGKMPRFNLGNVAMQEEMQWYPNYLRTGNYSIERKGANRLGSDTQMRVDCHSCAEEMRWIDGVYCSSSIYPYIP